MPIILTTLRGAPGLILMATVSILCMVLRYGVLEIIQRPKKANHEALELLQLWAFD